MDSGNPHNMREKQAALRLSSFARSLDISVSLARQWMRSGHIQTFKFGKLVMVPASEVDRIVAIGKGGCQ